MWLLRNFFSRNFAQFIDLIISRLKMVHACLTLVSAAQHAASTTQNMLICKSSFKQLFLIQYSFCKQTEILTVTAPSAKTLTLSHHAQIIKKFYITFFYCVISGQNSHSWVRSWKWWALTNCFHPKSLQLDFQRVFFLSAQRGSEFCFNTCNQTVTFRLGRSDYVAMAMYKN